MGICYSKQYTHSMEEKNIDISTIIPETIKIPYEKKIQLLYYQEYIKYNKYLK